MASLTYLIVGPSDSKDVEDNVEDELHDEEDLKMVELEENKEEVELSLNTICGASKHLLYNLWHR